MSEEDHEAQASPPEDDDLRFTIADYDDLTSAQREVLKLIARGYNSTSALADKRDCTKRAIQYHLEELREKGYIENNQIVLPEVDHTPRSAEGHREDLTHISKKSDGRNRIRLHNEHFVVDPSRRGEKYDEYVGSKTLVDGNTVMVSKDTVQVYSNKSFFSDSVRKVTVKALQYWTRFFRKVERMLGGAVLLKDRSNNIKRVQAHYAETENELSRQAEEEAERIRIYAEDDGKLWFEIDNSLDLNEAETTHPDSAEKDMADYVRPFFQSLREERAPLPEESWKILNKLQKSHEATLEHVRQIGAGLSTITEFLETQHEQQRQGSHEPQGNGGRPHYVG